MGVIVGIIGVIACVLIGFVGPGGSIPILFQPFEVLVIAGSAFCTLFVQAPASVLKATPGRVIGSIKGSGINKAKYNAVLGLMACIFDVMRKEGVLGVEGDLNDPHSSPRFNKYPEASHDHHLMETFTGGLRLIVDGVVNAFDLEKLLDMELETHHHEAVAPADLVNKLADSFPALGIVAAVLGIIITMNHLGGSPQEIGHHVAAALVGTMLGIFLSYGLVGPLAAKMAVIAHEEGQLLKTVQAALVSFAGGAPPQVALEFARRAIPSHFRANAEELEEIIRNAKKS